MNVTAASCPELKEKYLKWPATSAGQFAQVPCIAYLNGVFYDTTKNAYKYCRPNATWSPKKNISMCYPLKNKTLENLRGTNSSFDSTSILIYYIGYTLSIMFLMMALFILLKLKTLRCMRNVIHCHFIIAFILSDLSWIIFHLLFANKYSISYELQSVVPQRLIGCNIISIIYTYFNTANFFWMFAEGLFMYQMVIIGFTHKILALRYIVLIGWGTPLLIIFSWALAKFKSHGDICLIQNVKNRYDQIYIIPIFIVLIINFVILLLVIKLLFEKVNTSKSGGDINYLKSFKGFLFLIPHLGIIYLITSYLPIKVHNDTFRKFVIPLLVSTQGFFVSLYCCFMNKEVRLAILAEMKNMENRRKSSCTSSYLLPTSSTEVSNIPFLKRFSLVSSTSYSGRSIRKRSSLEEENDEGEGILKAGDRISMEESLAPHHDGTNFSKEHQHGATITTDADRHKASQVVVSFSDADDRKVFGDMRDFGGDTSPNNTSGDTSGDSMPGSYDKTASCPLELIVLPLDLALGDRPYTYVDASNDAFSYEKLNNNGADTETVSYIDSTNP